MAKRSEKKKKKLQKSNKAEMAAVQEVNEMPEGTDGSQVQETDVPSAEAKETDIQELQTIPEKAKLAERTNPEEEPAQEEECPYELPPPNIDSEAVSGLAPVSDLCLPGDPRLPLSV